MQGIDEVVQELLAVVLVAVHKVLASWQPGKGLQQLRHICSRVGRGAVQLHAQMRSVAARSIPRVPLLTGNASEPKGSSLGV